MGEFNKCGEAENEEQNDKNFSEAASGGCAILLAVLTASTIGSAYIFSQGVKILLALIF